MHACTTQRTHTIRDPAIRSIAKENVSFIIVNQHLAPCLVKLYVFYIRDFGDVDVLVPKGMISGVVVNSSLLNKEYACQVLREEVAVIAPIKRMATIHSSTILIYDGYIVFNRWNIEAYITNC